MSDLEQLIAQMPIFRLAQLGGKSVAEIAVFALGGATLTRGTVGTVGARASNGAARPAGPRANNGAPKRAAKADASVRTAAGRGDFDARILEAIASAGGPVRSVDIEGKVGGTPQQRRTALHRLVAAKKIKRAGKARATTYEAR